MPNGEVHRCARSRLTLSRGPLHWYCSSGRRATDLPASSVVPYLRVLLVAVAVAAFVCHPPSSLCVPRRRRRRLFCSPAQRLHRFRLRMRLPTPAESVWSHWTASLSFSAAVAAEMRSRHSWSRRASRMAMNKTIPNSRLEAVISQRTCAQGLYYLIISY